MNLSYLLRIWISTVFLSFSALAYDWPTSIFEDRFESSTVDTWSSLSLKGSNVSLTITTNTTYSGFSSLSCNIVPPTSNSRSFVSKSLPNLTNFNARFYFSVPSFNAFPSNYYFYFFSFVKAGMGDLEGLFLKRDSKGDLFLRSRKLGDTPFKIGTNSWHCIESHYESQGDFGVVSYKIDDQPLFSGTHSAFSNYINEIRLGVVENISSSTLNTSIAFDDLCVSTNIIGPSHILSVIHPDLTGRVGAKILSIIAGTNYIDSISFDLTSDKGYHTNLFSTPSPRKLDSFLLTFRNLPEGNYILTGHLYSTNNILLDTYSYSFTRPTADIPTISIDEHNNIILSNKLFFPVMPYVLKPHLTKSWFNNRYINMLFGCDWLNRTPTGVNTYLSTANNNNLLCWAPLPFPSGNKGTSNEITPAVISNWVSILKTNANIAGWVFADEPEIYGYLPFDHYSWWRVAKSIDPSRLTQVNLMGLDFISHNRLARDWCLPYLVADIYGLDCYPVEYTNQFTMQTMALAMDRLKQWNQDLVPFFSYVQTCDVHPDRDGPEPTPDQVWFMAWLSIIKGAKGIQWFHYFNPTPPSIYATMSRFTQFVESYTDVILGEPIEVTSNNPFVHVMCRRARDSVWFFIANTSDVSTNYAIFTDLVEDDDSLRSLDSSDRIQCSKASFSDVIPAQSIRMLYRIPHASPRITRIIQGN